MSVILFFIFLQDDIYKSSTEKKGGEWGSYLHLNQEKFHKRTHFILEQC